MSRKTAESKEIWELILSDYYRISGNKSKIGVIKKVLKGDSFAFNFYFRLSRSKNKVVYLFSRIMYRKYKIKYGVYIPIDTEIGPGFFIAHGRDVTINQNVIIGKNCCIHQYSTIAGSPDKGVPVIGDNVFIFASVNIIGEVKIGNSAVIGAGSVVTKDIPEGATVAGVPAKVLNFTGLSNEYIKGKNLYQE